MVAALANCPDALQQLLHLVSHSGLVLAAAAGEADDAIMLVSVHSPCVPALPAGSILHHDSSKETCFWLLSSLLTPSPCPTPSFTVQGGLSMDLDDGALAAAAGDAPQPRLVPAAVHAPQLLHAVVSSSHADALAAWLPLAEAISQVVAPQVAKRQAVGAAAAQAAFPPCPPPGSAMPQGGLPQAVTLGSWDMAAYLDSTYLLHLQGHAAPVLQLLQLWRGGNGSCCGTGSCLLELLARLLPQLHKVDDPNTPWLTDDALEASSAAAARGAGGDPKAWPQLQGAAAASGVPPPAGMDVATTDAVMLMRDSGHRCGTLTCLNILGMLLRGAPHALRCWARKLADRSCASGRRACSRCQG